MNLGRYEKGDDNGKDLPNTPVTPDKVALINETPEKEMSNNTIGSTKHLRSSSGAKPDPPEQSRASANNTIASLSAAMAVTGLEVDESGTPQTPSRVSENRGSPTPETPAKEVDFAPPAGPALASNTRSSSNLGRKQGDLIVLGGSVKQAKSFDSSPSESSSRSMSKRKSSKKSPGAFGAALGGAAVVGGATAVAVAAKNNSSERQEASMADMRQVSSASTSAAPSEAFKDEGSSRVLASAAPAPVKASVYGDSQKAIDEEAPSTPMKTRDGFANEDDPAGVNQVNHNFNAQPSRSRSIMGMSRVMFAGVAVAAVGAAGLGIWTGTEVPKLNSQVRDLEEQVDRLEVQVDRLAEENMRFNNSNNILNASIHFFQEQNVILNETSQRLNQSVFDLADEIVELQAVNAELRNVTDAIAVQNDVLNQTNQVLLANVVELNAHVTDLESRNEELQEIENNLSTNVTFFTEQNDALNQTQQELEALLASAQQVNDQLRQSLNDLEDVTRFLNESVGGVNEDLVAVADQLSEAIEFNRMLGIENLHLTYQDALHNWDCPMGDSWPDEFMNPENVIPGPEPLQSILNDMNTATGLVTNICLDRTNYEAYLNHEYDITTPQMTTTEFVTGTNIYGNDALTYMFPNPGQQGLTHADWEAASYLCENIAKFEWSIPAPP